MGYWLADPGERTRTDFLKRFDPRYWTVNFPRPMMAAATTTPAGDLRVEAVFYRRNDLVGVIWQSEDGVDHPLLRYETARDYRGILLTFRVRLSGAVTALDAVNGPVLTLEGRDALGVPRTWYVRLWNYAQGDADDALITLDFDALDGGFLLPSEADPVWAGDLDRLFISLTPPGYDGVDAPLAVPAEGVLELLDIVCDGPGAVLTLGDAFTPPHGLRLASGYDDVYNITPARFLRAALHLGYRGDIDHYVGMSHYARLVWQAGEGRYVATLGGGVLNAPCLAWHGDFFARAAALGYSVTAALSYELFFDNAPLAWMQRDYAGAPALTGWSPPSTLLSPVNAEAMGYLQSVAGVFVGVQVAQGLPPRLQIGEPWWWSGYGAAPRRPCFYDAATLAAYPVQTGLAVPTFHEEITEVPTVAQTAYLAWLGEKLGDSTAALRDAVKALYPSAMVSLLVFTPQTLDSSAPMLALANLPDDWAWPSYDRLQLEDYDYVVSGNASAHRAGLANVRARFGYPLAQTDYFSGFVLDGADRALWREIMAAADEATAAGYDQVYLWAYPQVARDGLVVFELAEGEEMLGFHDVQFPLEVGYGARGGPEFSTTIATAASGAEQRNVNWAQGRLRFDAGLGVRSEADIALLLRFFRARRGRGYGFRFQDPFDHSSALLGTPVTPLDQILGVGDGVAVQFELVKTYTDAGGSVMRRITRPVPGSVRVAVAGVELLSGWAVLDRGIVSFDVPPEIGAAVTAGYRFDVPVRFDEDRVEASLETVAAGQVPSIPLVEIRED